MDTEQSPPVIAFVPTAVLFVLIGLGGLAWLFLNTLPTVGPRWMFYFLWFVGITGLALPLVAFLNRRFAGKAPADQKVIVRQASWFGFYGCLLAWLQIGRIVTSSLALLLLLGLIVIEAMLRLREGSKWRKGE